MPGAWHRTVSIRDILRKVESMQSPYTGYSPVSWYNREESHSGQLYHLYKAVLSLCPEYDTSLRNYIIVRESPESYIPQIRKVPELLDPHIQLGAQKTALQRRMRKEHGVDFKELRQLSSIYMVSVSGKKLVSKISEGQKKLLERLELELEVD